MSLLNHVVGGEAVARVGACVAWVLCSSQDTDRYCLSVFFQKQKPMLVWWVVFD